MNEVHRRMIFGRLRKRRTGMSLHFMQMVAAHGQRVSQWQVDRGKPYWRRTKRRPIGSAPRLGVRERAYNYARQNLAGSWPHVQAKASARASAAEGLVLFHLPERARVGLLRLGYTRAQARNLIKRRPRMQGATPTYTVIDEVIDGAA